MTPHDYRAEQVAPGADVEPVVAAAGAEGYRAIAAVGDAASEWIILERPDGATPRDVRVVSGTGVSTVEAAINALAKEDFDVDAVWNRAPKGFGLFRDPALMASVSRRRGAAAKAAPVAISFGREPDTVGQFVAVVPFRGRFAFVVRIDERSDYATREIEWTNAAPKESVGRVAVPGDPAPRVVEAGRGGLGHHLGQQGHTGSRSNARSAVRRGRAAVTARRGSLRRQASSRRTFTERMRT